jgi:calcineurin-like phosphoesterase family protein
MGWYFPIQSANLVAYLTIEAAYPPRVTGRDLSVLLDAIGRRDDVENLISSDPTWAQTTKAIAAEACASLGDLAWRDDNFVSPDVVEQKLRELRAHFAAYDLYGLAVGVSPKHDDPLSALARHCAFGTGHRALILIPDVGPAPIDLVDPFEPFAQALERPQDWPGMLYWSKRGCSAFAPLADARILYERSLAIALQNDPGAVDDILRKYRSSARAVQLLHLSDLHFGTRWAAENEALLAAQLERVAREANRVVITGDLCDNPKREDAIAFRNFRLSLKRLTGKDPIVVPGNHDQKWLGNVSSGLRELAQLEWSTLVPDHDIECVFFCFDSSIDANLAKGRVTSNQMRDVGTMFATECAGNPEVEHYLRIALIHHHPFTFETKSQTLVQRLLAGLGMDDETFLRMDDADLFLRFCAKSGVPLVLHGHKHVQRHVQEIVHYDTGGREANASITAVGCGASLGANGKNLSYNLLTWDPRSRRWCASFFASDPDGSGFTRQYVALHGAVSTD